MVQDMNLRNGTLCKNAVLAMVAIVAAVMVALGAAVFVGTTEAYADQQAFTTTSKGNSGETWIYVDGQNGNDSNDGTSADKAVKTWEKAKNLLGCEKGGIIVKGTVDASGVISTNDPSQQVVKRDADIVMFNVSGEATFANINVDGGGASNNFDSPAIQPASGSTLNFLSGAVFHDVGYDGWSEDRPTTWKGGVVCALTKGLNILIDGATFENNAGKGIFYAPIEGFYGGYGDVKLFMKSGSVTNNMGFFYHNEYQDKSNKIFIYNALITENDASNTGARYSSYKNRNGVVYVCDFGSMNLRSTEGAAIFGNTSHDLIYIKNPGADQQIYFENPSTMLGGGNPNWTASRVDDSFVHPEDGLREQYYDVYDASPSEGHKADAVKAATSVFKGNKSIVINSNGVVNFGKDSESVPETPTVELTQGCDDDTPGTDTPGTDTPGTDTPGTDTPGDDTPEETTQTEEKDPTNTPSEIPSETTEVEEKEPQNNPAGTDEEEKEKPSQAAPSKAANANNSQSTPSKLTTPKTADGAGTAIVSLAALAALAMATGVYSLRRREER